MTDGSADLILGHERGADPFPAGLVISSLPPSQHSGRRVGVVVVVVGKILLANCRQTHSALDMRSSWKNDTVLYSTRYHPSKPSPLHIALFTASCVMKSDNAFKCLWLWGAGEALLQRRGDDVLLLPSGCSSAQESRRKSPFKVLVIKPR